MNIYYLYVKTHQKTGLHYLGKTEKDPFSYKGSGLHWCRHVSKHGNKVDTVILKKCYSKESIKSWGIFYSRLWSIVKSKKWANIREESGDGGDTSKTPNYINKWHLFGTNPVYNKDHSGKNNPNCDHTEYEFRHKDGRIERCTRIEMTTKYGIKPSKIIRTPGITCHGWYIGNTPKERISKDKVHTFDHTIYNFVNDVGTKECMTRFDLRSKYPILKSKGLSLLCRGHIKKYQGWFII